MKVRDASASNITECPGVGGGRGPYNTQENALKMARDNSLKNLNVHKDNAYVYAKQCPNEFDLRLRTWSAPEYHVYTYICDPGND